MSRRRVWWLACAVVLAVIVAVQVTLSVQRSDWFVALADTRGCRPELTC